jgi:CDP-glycerol glycerophosphotransferase
MTSNYRPRAQSGSPAPLISFVIPVFNVENYLVECLQSITRQSFRDIEVVAIDGKSDDGSGEILDEMGEQDPRFTVLHATSKIGPGNARNEGLAHATGEYVWFVDGDDVISSGCLEAIVQRIEVTRPDVLLIDYEARDPNGRLSPGHGHKLIASAPVACFTLAEQPWAIELSMSSWNKIVRREFLLSIAAPFVSDWPHEDIPFSCLSLMEARRISVLNRVCYRYSKNRRGSAMKSGDPKRHFKVFSSYESVLDELAKRISNGDQMLTEDVQRALFRRAIWHFTTILDTGGFGIGPVGIDGLVRRRDRHQFFRNMHGDFVYYRPAGYHPGGGPRGIKFRLVEKNAYWLYSILEPVNKIRTKIILGRRAARC